MCKCRGVNWTMNRQKVSKSFPLTDGTITLDMLVIPEENKIKTVTIKQIIKLNTIWGIFALLY